MEEDDMDFGHSKSRSAKKGRRARQTALPPDSTPADDAGETVDMASTETPAVRDPDAPPRPSRRVGGWGDDTPKGGNRRRGAGGIEEIEDERLRPHSDREDDSDNDIPVIPDLEDNQEEEITTTIAQAPNVAVNRVATYRELDNDLLKHAAFLTLDNDIDLKLLAKNLSPEADIIEEDRAWEWDRLFTEVTSELITEWERNENPETPEQA